MKKNISIFIASVFAAVFVLGGCSGSNNKVQDGVNKMIDTTSQLSKAIKSGDQKQVKKVGPTLEDQWSSFEDDVKKDNKDLYNKVEKYLDPTVAGSKAATLDKTALGTLNDQLRGALKELADKVK